MDEQFEKIYKKSHIKLKNKNKNKIRVGYYSADFRNHATSHLIAEMLRIMINLNSKFLVFILEEKLIMKICGTKELKKVLINSLM